MPSTSKTIKKTNKAPKKDKVTKKRNYLKRRTNYELEQCTRSISETHPFINELWLEQIRNLVYNATIHKKIFVISGHVGGIRKALLQRGWIEKLRSNDVQSFSEQRQANQFVDLCLNLPLLNPRVEDEYDHMKHCEEIVKSRMLKYHPPDLYWNVQPSIDVSDHVLVNHINRSYFTEKSGLCVAIKQNQWIHEINVANINCPRCYRLSFNDCIYDFVEDYRITACMSLLKTFIYRKETDGILGIQCETGTLSMNIIDFAIKRLIEYIEFKTNLDIDKDDCWIANIDWYDFICKQFLFVKGNEKFETISSHDISVILNCGKMVLTMMKKYWPQYDLDGMRNIWILKPENKSRGVGISLVNNYDVISSVVSKSRAEVCRYVIQKYIENPLLVYGNKFDIRQWFLVTSSEPLHIWMYKDCYCRFSSKKFTLDNFHEVIHLTNHAVQIKHKNSVPNSKIPLYNMWDLQEFQLYLKKIGKTEKWDNCIYPKMRESIIGVLLASQENMIQRTNNFQLYGADFIVDENFIPWLIEINACPDMSKSTPITEKMCEQCFDDVVKVLIDLRDNPNTDTGMFECIYKQTFKKGFLHKASGLSVKGSCITKLREFFFPIEETKEKSVNKLDDCQFSISQEDLEADDLMLVKIKQNLRTIFQYKAD